MVFQPQQAGDLKDKVLMIDARNVYRKVTRKIYDFSSEQQQNLTAIVWLYRGQRQRFIELVQFYIAQSVSEGRRCFEPNADSLAPMPEFLEKFGKLYESVTPFFESLKRVGSHQETWRKLNADWKQLKTDQEQLKEGLEQLEKQWDIEKKKKPSGLLSLVEDKGPLSELARQSRGLAKQIDLVFKHATWLIDLAEKELNAKESDLWEAPAINGARKNSMKKEVDAARKIASEQLKQMRYFRNQAHWLLSRFPDAEIADVEGLVKLVDKSKLEANDWSLTPGRYVGVAPEEVDEEFDFEETMKEIHSDLQTLNEEAARLAKQIQQNFEELGI